MKPRRARLKAESRSFNCCTLSALSPEIGEGARPPGEMLARCHRCQWSYPGRGNGVKRELKTAPVWGKETTEKGQKECPEEARLLSPGLRWRAPAADASAAR